MLRPTAIMAMLLLSACAQASGHPDSPPHSFVDAYGVNLKVSAVNQELLIDLPGNPGTGFSWAIEHAPAFLKQIGEEEYVPDKPSGNMVGAGGAFRWRFLAQEKGTDTLRFVYRRPWEKGKSPADTAEYRVVVEERL
jgi:inhibitor of cysteine peptidase